MQASSCIHAHCDTVVGIDIIKANVVSSRKNSSHGQFVLFLGFCKDTGLSAIFPNPWSEGNGKIMATSNLSKYTSSMLMFIKAKVYWNSFRNLECDSNWRFRFLLRDHCSYLKKQAKDEHLYIEEVAKFL